MSVKVAVRVRPFDQREKTFGPQLCVEMQGQKTILFDLEDPKKTRDFTFDYSFWSHDGFDTDDNGFLFGTSPRYADQQSIFDSVGQEILTNAWEGYHCNLFTYGQTGAGKTHSMLGYGVNKGIVQMIFDEIFKKIKQNTDQNKQYDVKVSMLEIYNGKVHDLSTPFNKRTAEGLKVRENKIYGVYVEGLTKYQVNSYEAIETKIDEVNKQRTVGATLMNSCSSRAHTIIQIEFKQIIHIETQNIEKSSMINLVDLAGSEQVSKTGASGERLKEASNINTSLTVLGKVISALAAKSMGNGKNIFVPYRDSLLTRILQNAFGGNSKTLMLCAISPAVVNYDETLSTLRYADQFKKIKNNAAVNDLHLEKKILQEKEEMIDLKEQLLGDSNLIKDNLEVQEHSIQDMEDVNQQEQKDINTDEAIHQNQQEKEEKSDQHQQDLIIIDNQFEQLISVKDEICNLLQSLQEKNQQSHDFLVQLNGLTQQIIKGEIALKQPQIHSQ